MDLTLVLTHACNLGCRYCYAGAKDARTMPAATGRRAIDWAVANARGALRLAYFGGEPLTRWELLTDLHAYARARTAAAGVALTASVTTNGTLLDDARMAWLAAHGVVVGLSIDGDHATHDRLRPLAGGGSSFARCRDGLRTALRHRPLTQTISVVDPANVDDLPATVGFLLGEGVRVLSLSLNPAADWDLGDLERLRMAMERVGDRWLAELRAGRDVYIDPLEGKVIARIKGGLAGCDRCDAGGRELALSPAGHWYGCERLVGADGPTEARWRLGCLHETADGGPDPAIVARFAAAHAAQPAECAACPVRDRCQHSCACSNIMASGHPAEPGGAQCAAEQIAIAVADRVAATLYAEGNPVFLAKQYRLVPASSA